MKEHFPVGDWVASYSDGLSAALASSACQRNGREQEIERATLIAETLQTLHARLSGDAGFQGHLARLAAGELTNPDWTTLYQDKGVRFGLLAIPQRTQVSFHDHPDTTGVMMLLSGRVSVLTCALSARTGDRSAMLEVVAHRKLGIGEMAAVTRNKENIHRLQSIEERCIVIDLLVEGRDAIPRNWYFPLEGSRSFSPGERFPATTYTDWRGIR